MGKYYITVESSVWNSGCVQENVEKKVKREKGLLLWKAESKLTGSYLRIPNGATVGALYTKSWYTKVRYKGKVGYVNKKFVE